jgi:acyl carrier protein
MADTREILIDCFQTVFGSLPRERVAQATKDNVPEWDSVQMQTLIAVVEETFGYRVTPKDLELFTSFSGILELLQSRAK